MTIAAGGNVGIGTTGPDQKLYVNGNILTPNSMLIRPTGQPNGGQDFSFHTNNGALRLYLDAQGTDLMQFSANSQEVIVNAPANFSVNSSVINLNQFTRVGGFLRAMAGASVEGEI